MANANGKAATGVPDKVSEKANPEANEATEIAGNIIYHAKYSPHFSPLKFGPEQALYATAESLRDRLIQLWNETYLHFHKVDPKQTYYLSMEYLQGRALTNAIGNLDLNGPYADALRKLGYELEEIAEQEKDAALGNGGLGRLASCFLDSMATLNLPAWGYGLRYRHGLFKQLITKKGQEEVAEDWLEKFSPWEIVRHDVVFPVRFFGHVQINPDGSRKWVGGDVVQALAYDVPIPGFKTKNTISLRLWEAKARAEDLDLFQFNEGEYELAAQLHSRAQQICTVLYPGDATENGKLLRLKQQFFLCSASLQDIISRFNERSTGEGSRKWSEFPSKVAVQMNDTHPTLAIPELMRLLMDDNGLGWDEAWDVTSKTVAYTNHTVLPEALEKWSQSLMRKLLPRHMEIIEEIDKRFVQTIRSTRVDLEDKLSSLSILDHNPQKPVVRMANLCVVSSHTVNGVAQLHSDILKDELFADYVSIWPNKFQNKTNGITPRRWLRFCSPELSDIITKWLKTDKWITDLDLLTGLRQFADNEELQSEWASAKEANKQRLAQYIERVTGVSIDTNSLFDIQVKRIHEYKRQLMNILGVIYRFKKLKEMKPEERKKTTPRTVMIGGKAFATYTNAKRIVKLVNDVGDVVNSDPEVNEYLKVVFVPNYNVTVAEMLIPGSELSQHISTAGGDGSKVVDLDGDLQQTFKEKFGSENVKFVECGCWLCDQHHHSSPAIQDKAPAGMVIDAEPEERRMSYLSDWCSSDTTAAEIHFDNLLLDQDMLSLRKECQEKDETIKDLTSFLQLTNKAGSKRETELEEIIRRKKTIIKKLKRDVLVLEEKVTQLTRPRRWSCSAAIPSTREFPMRLDNLLYDVDASTSSSSSDSETPPAYTPRPTVLEDAPVDSIKEKPAALGQTQKSAPDKSLVSVVKAVEPPSVVSPSTIRKPVSVSSSSPPRMRRASSSSSGDSRKPRRPIQVAPRASFGSSKRWV